MGYGLGVDIGTTFVAAAVSRGDRAQMCALGSQAMVVPAVAYLTEDAGLIFGEAAERRVLSEPGRAERHFKRRLGDPNPVLLGGVPYQVTELMAGQLRDVLDTVTRAQGGPPDRVALTCPAGWGPYRRELFEEVPRLAGISDHVVLSEPEAAAAHYGASRFLGDGGALAVYDLGGGSFDATVLRECRGAVELVGQPDGIERLGGIDFDEAIIQWINCRYGAALAEFDLSEPGSAVAVARLRQECVRAKEALSSHTTTSIPVMLPNRLLPAELSRRDFETLIRPSIASTVGALVRAVQEARVGVTELAAVVLVGGSSRIPLIGQTIAEELGRPILTDAHPKYPVALGAAAVATGMPPAVPGRRIPVAAGPADEAATQLIDPVRLDSPASRGISRPARPGGVPEPGPPARRGRRWWRRRPS